MNRYREGKKSPSSIKRINEEIQKKYLENQLGETLEVIKNIHEYLSSQRNKQILYSKEEIESMVIKICFKLSLKPVLASEILKFTLNTNEYIDEEGKVFSPGEQELLSREDYWNAFTHNGTIPL